MQKSRLEPLAAETMDCEQRRVAEALIKGPRGSVRGPFPALLRRPELADCARAMGDCIRNTSTIPLPLREIAILTVARYWDASYEWAAHVKVAREIGLDGTLVDTIKAKKRPANADADQLLVYDFCTESLLNHDVSDATYDAALARFEEAGIIDLIGIVGYFSLACMIFNLARIPSADPMEILTR